MVPYHSTHKTAECLRVEWGCRVNGTTTAGELLEEMFITLTELGKEGRKELACNHEWEREPGTGHCLNGPGCCTTGM